MTISKSFKEYCYGTVILNISETWGWFIDLDINDGYKRKHTFSNNKNLTLLRNINIYHNTKKNPLIIKRLRSRPSLSSNLNNLENNSINDFDEMDNDFEEDIRGKNSIGVKIIYGLFIVFIGIYIVHLLQ